MASLIDKFFGTQLVFPVTECSNQDIQFKTISVIVQSCALKIFTKISNGRLVLH